MESTDPRPRGGRGPRSGPDRALPGRRVKSDRVLRTRTPRAPAPRPPLSPIPAGLMPPPARPAPPPRVGCGSSIHAVVYYQNSDFGTIRVLDPRQAPSWVGLSPRGDRTGPGRRIV